MKILSLHIDAFGKLRDYRLELEGGLNEILGENGYGKTTLAVFVKSMLYGIPDNRDKGKVRKKYAPWSGGDFGGTLDFETERGRYRVERRFAPKTGDTFALYDLKTGLLSEDYTEDLGFELFSVDAESFEKCAYLPQHEVDIKLTDSINARLTALLFGSADSDMVDSQEAIEAIRARRRELEAYRGTGGLIERERQELAMCEQNVAALEGKLRNAGVIRAEIISAEARESEAESKINELEAELKAEHENALVRKDHEIWRGYLSEAERWQARAEQLEAEFKNGIPSASELDRAELLERDIDFAQRKRRQTAEASKNAGSETETAVPQQYEISSRIYDARELEKKRAELAAMPQIPSEPSEPQKASRLSLVLAAVLGVVGIALMLIGLSLPMLLVLGGAMLVAAAVCGILYIASGKRAADLRRGFEEAVRARREISERRAVKEREIRELEGELGAFFEKYNVSSGVADPVAELDKLAEKAERRTALSREALAAEDDIKRLDAEIWEKERELGEFLERYGFFGANERTAGEIRELIKVLDAAKLSFSERKESADKFKVEKGLSDEPPTSSRGERELSGELDTLREGLRELAKTKSALAERAALLEAQAEALPTAKDRMLELTALIEEHSERRDILDMTEKYLEMAKDNLSSRHTDNMEKSFKTRFAAITDSEREIKLDAKLELKLRDEGGLKKADEYSTGWQAVIAICQRLALIDSLYGEERPFLILDDPFVNLDGEKLARSKKILQELAEDTQIIYLTCHESRSIK